MSLYAWSLELLHLCSAGHFGTNVGYTTPYDVFIPFFLIFFIPKYWVILEKGLQLHLENDFGHEKFDFMYFVSAGHYGCPGGFHDKSSFW